MWSLLYQTDDSLEEIIGHNCHKFPTNPKSKITSGEVYNTLAYFKKENKIFKTQGKDEMYIFRGL